MNIKEISERMEREERCKSVVVWLIGAGDSGDKLILPKGSIPVGGKAGSDTHTWNKFRLPSGELIIVSQKRRPPVELLLPQDAMRGLVEHLGT